MHTYYIRIKTKRHEIKRQTELWRLSEP